MSTSPVRTDVGEHVDSTYLPTRLWVSMHVWCHSVGRFWFTYRQREQGQLINASGFQICRGTYVGVMFVVMMVDEQTSSPMKICCWSCRKTENRFIQKMQRGMASIRWMQVAPVVQAQAGSRRETKVPNMHKIEDCRFDESMIPTAVRTQEKQHLFVNKAVGVAIVEICTPKNRLPASSSSDSVG